MWLLGVHEYTNTAFHRAHEGVEGAMIMDVARSVGNTTHNAAERQAMYDFGFAIGLELFAHSMEDEHRRAFMLELGAFKSAFDLAQKPDASSDDIITAVRLSEEAYEAYQNKPAVHSVSEEVWRYLEPGQGNVADFETAIGMISLAVDNSRFSLESEHESGSESEHLKQFDLFDLFKAPSETPSDSQEVTNGMPFDFEEARGIIFRSFERSPHMRSLRDGSITTRADVLTVLGRAVVSLNSGPPNLPFLEQGTDASLLSGSFYMIYDRTERTKTYHVLPEGWKLFGTFDRFSVDDIPSLDELRGMTRKKPLEEFRTSYPGGLFMLLRQSELSYGDASSMALGQSQEVYVPLNYPLRGTLLAPSTGQ